MNVGDNQRPSDAIRRAHLERSALVNLGEPCAEAEQQPIDRNETACRGLRPTQSEALRGTKRPIEAFRGLLEAF